MNDQQKLVEIFERAGFSIHEYERGYHFEVQGMNDTISFDFDDGSLENISVQ